MRFFEFQNNSSVLKGIFMMVIAMSLLPFMDAVAKILTFSLSPLQIVWARVFFGALFVFPLAIQRGTKKVWQLENPLIQIVRSLLLVISTLFFVYALKFLTPADTLAIFFVMPLVITAFSPLVLKEYVGLHRWCAVLCGFCGTLVIIRPGFTALNAGVLFALAAGVTQAFFMLLTRKIAQNTDVMVTNFHTNLAGLILLTPFAFWNWSPSTGLFQWQLMALLGFISVCGHYFMIKAYEFAPASVVSPMIYWEMIPATAIGYFLFNKIPDHWTFAGVLLLVASAVYVSYRERRHSVDFSRASRPVHACKVKQNQIS